MKQRHKHADVIIAWAEGKDVQVWVPELRKWCDLIESSTWCEDCKYRIKPAAKKYRVALFKDPDYYTSTANIQEDAEFYESSCGFVRWLTDWIEYEQ